MAICMEPIGVVHTDSSRVPRHWTLSDVKGTLVIDEKYREGMKDIEVGQRIVVIFYFHKSPKFIPEMLAQQPPHRDRKLGVFSICSPQRPNPVGMSIVDVLDVEENSIHVQGLDMFDGTPILDLKPFVTGKLDCPSHG